MRLGFLAVLAALGLSAPAAHALQQPGGATIPSIDSSVTSCSDRNVQVCLDTEEGGSTINTLTAAAVTPETFNPACGLTFKVLARGAGFLNTFGWYNVTTQKPLDSDLHAFLLCSDAPGTTKTLDLKNDPAYLGGKIGFFMATPEGASGNCPQFNATGGPVAGTVGKIYYSERAYNPDNVGSNSFIHLIVYDSVAHPNSFYFAWEDLLSGGDNDFDDLLTRVEGITCAGGGAACDTGQLGKCQDGTMQCKNGQLVCVQNQQPTNESCNGRDDDCNGSVDDGAPCPPDTVCDRGKCVPRCGTGEFACPVGSVCNSAGLCVDAGCETKTCGSGQICVEGKCQAPCDGIVCPAGQLCREGQCVDPCDGLSCDTGYVCVAGVCSLHCDCQGCGSGQTCDTSSQKCVDDGCSPDPCGAGQICKAGQCSDACAGAVCPKGQSCEAGQCVDDPDAGAGGGSGGLQFDGGIVTGGGGGSGAKDAGGTAALGGYGVGSPKQEDAGGCGCRLPTRRPGGAFASLLALLWLARRRRRNIEASNST
ncbi:MAG: DUF4114 domain-containing protein [Polyangiaceae bacterium]